jgi:hypothetical protein
MSAHGKARRPQRDWRKKQTNLAKLRYFKEDILFYYSESAPPLNVQIPESLFSASLPPILLTKPKIACENSRTLKKKTEKPLVFKIEISEIKEEQEKHEDDLNEIIDSYYQSLSKTEGKSENTSELIINYPEELIISHVKLGNPFALLINKYSSKANQCVVPLEQSHNKRWYYQDSFHRIHGPFSSVEMFNWTAAGYFTTSLLVAENDPVHFYSLKMYMSLND